MLKIKMYHHPTDIFAISTESKKVSHDLSKTGLGCGESNAI